ncbi:hypothetical protein J437_LFUL017143 [Ladona fulva]|uniref:Uncharacterized protein n=1 Tax=Ladona fulva TaxID=123851 RepID=A0A8K0PAZ7_LADFU|nr:hypothetical protein J437_LFUL017143 [Ladona fulva]
MIENIQPGNSKTTLRKNFIIPKLVAALDRCQVISPRFNEFVRKNGKSVPGVVTVHWDAKLFPALDARESKEERLPIVMLYVNKEQLIAVPRLESSSESGQAQAVCNAIVDWNLEDKVQFFVVILRHQIHVISVVPVCFLNKNLREIYLFLRQQNLFVFEVKISQVTTNSDIPPFKKFRDNWKIVDPNKIQVYQENLKFHLTVSEIDNMLEFCRTELTNEIARDDFRELIELNHFIITSKDKAALLEVCLFIVTSYVKP